MENIVNAVRRNRMRIIILAILAFILFTATQGMDTEDWVVTLFRGLSVGAVTFLVAAGLSIIFGLMDVLNLAHGALFMIGAYVGWSVYIRPDTFVDVLTPLLLLSVGIVLLPLWSYLLHNWEIGDSLLRYWPWLGLVVGVGLLFLGLIDYPIAIWSTEVYAESPITYSLLFDQGNLTVPPPAVFSDRSPWLVFALILVGGSLTGLSLTGIQQLRRGGSAGLRPPLPRSSLILAAVLGILGIAFYLANDALTNFLFNLNSFWLFLIGVLIATITGVLMGALIEITFIRPLYARPIYQLMMTLGLAFIGTEFVRAVWGRPEISVPRPGLFNATGDGCPATSIGGWLSNGCSTILFMDSRVRTYNEIFIIFVGILVLVLIWFILQRSRLGMIVRAGVQDSEMVEALGINVRQVFTIVFAIGVGLAALGGALAGPSMGLSNGMGESLLLLALIALAIGGLTSFPGAAAGALLVGILQQFLIKYGQIGINIPFLEEPFKPTPPLIPASTVLFMVIILLLMPQGLFGRSE